MATSTNSHYDTDIQFVEFAQANMKPESFQSAMRYIIGKYITRYGAKDDIVKESEKILDYALWLYMSAKGLVIDPRNDNHETIIECLCFDEEETNND